MKKTLLLMTGFCLTLMSYAQVSVFVKPGSVNVGSYDNEYVTAAQGWGVNDLTDPVNRVEGYMRLVDDGTAADSLGCNTLVNGAYLSGHIAVIWRGACEFGSKALKAQNAGAIGVIIVNHTGEPVGMGAGAEGSLVTIPTVMISQAAGYTLYDDIIAGDKEVIIGNLFGLYDNNLSIIPNDVYRPNQFATPVQLAQNASEFDVNVGGWIWNFGNNDLTDVVLNCTIEFGGSDVYTFSSTPVSLDSGDSLWIAGPTFSQPTYAQGYYTMTYTLSSSVTDDFDFDNVVHADFMITDKKFSHAMLSSTTQLPNNTKNNGFNNSVTEMRYCVHFSDPNASRLIAKGLTFSSATNTFDNEELIGRVVDLEIWKWNDVVKDIDAGITAVEFISSTQYSYDNDLQNQFIDIMFEEFFVLENNTSYFFCFYNNDDYGIQFPVDKGLDYYQNIFDDAYSPTINGGLPTTVAKDDTQWYYNGFGTDEQAAIVINFALASELGIEDNNMAEQIIAYPNPAVNEITVPFGTQTGMTTLNIYDISGKLVSTQTFEITGDKNLKVDVSNMENGMYIFHVNYENGTSNRVNVVVSK